MDRAQSQNDKTVNCKESPKTSNPTSAFSFWVSKFKFLKNKARVSSKRYQFDGMMVSNSVYCESGEMEVQEEECGDSNLSGNEVEEWSGDSNLSGNEVEEGSGDSNLNGNEEEVGSGDSNLNCDSLADSCEVILNDENSSCEDSCSPHFSSFEVSEEVEKPHLDKRKLEKQGSCLSETEMMKERFAKLLLGEDMSGCGNGVATALAISNAITNLCATLFGQIWRLEPLQMEKKIMWRREMNWLLCVSDHIVELIPSCQTFPDGTKLEVMTSRPRGDLYVNLPALRKLDNMLLEILESFKKSTEFWYVEPGILTPEADGTSSFRKPLPRQEEKWWLPVPRVQPGGLSDDARRMLQHKRDSTNQILKAAMAINNAALAEMDIPDSYLEALPKNGKASLGDTIHRYINSDQFSPECLFDCLELSSEHQALEIANKVEATLLMWRQKMKPKPLHKAQRSNSRSSWEMVKDFVSDADKREVLAGRAESLLLCLKQRFPGLPQTSLDMTKIQYNKDVGKSILESYSRVLESLAFNIVARIDDLLYVDNLSKHSDQLISISKVGVITHKSTSPFKTPLTNPTFSPSHLITPSKGSVRGFGVRRILTEYLNIDGKTKDFMRRSDSFSSMTGEVSTSPSFESSRGSIEVVSRHEHETD